jgi:hypothetical protein
MPAPPFASVAAGVRVVIVTAQDGSMWEVRGTSLRRIDSPPACGWVELLAGGGRVLVQCRSTSAGMSFFERAAGAWTRVATHPSPDVRGSLSPDGQLRAGGPAGTLYHGYRGGTWLRMAYEPGPPGRAVAGRSSGELYAGGRGGVARLVGDRWEVIAGTERMDAQALFQAPDGILFVAVRVDAPDCVDPYDGSRCPDWIDLYRYDGVRWTRDARLSGFEARQMVGTSSANVAVTVDCAVHRYDGRAWRRLGDDCGSTGNIAFGGGELFRVVTSFEDPSSIEQWSGRGWSAVSGLRAHNLFQIGTASPTALMVSADASWWAYDASGWRRGTFGGFAAGDRFVSIAGPSMDRLVASLQTDYGYEGGLARVVGGRFGPVTADWAITDISPYHFWTDGRSVVSAGFAGPFHGSRARFPGSEALLRCHLGE